MSVLLRLLPLLVVGCLLLQSLQPTVVSGQEICDQTIEGEEALAFEDFAWEYGKQKSKPTKPPKSDKVIKPKAKRKRISKTHKDAAKERLLKHPIKEINGPEYKALQDYHMPFKFDDSKAVKKSDVVLLFQDSFINRYSKKRKTPIFTSQRLDGKALKLLKKNGQLPNRDETEWFRVERRLKKTETTTCKAYKGSGYDRGHVTPSAGMLNAIAQTNTFQLSNMAPQHPKHNQIAWRLWEDYTRKKAEDKETDVYVITGSTPGTEKLSDGTIVPAAWYKVLAWRENGKLHAEYIYTKHENSADPETEWGSTQIGMEHRNLKPSKKTVEQVVKFIKEKTKIEFKINEFSLNAGTTPVTKALNTVSKDVKMEEASKQEFDDIISSFCDKMRRKLHQLANTGKLTLSQDNNREEPGENVLDLGKGSFSAGCRKVSDVMLHEYFDDNLDVVTDQFDSTEVTSQSLIGYVSNGQTVRLLDLLDVPESEHLSAINIKLKKIVSDCEAKHVDIYSAPSSTFTFIPGVFSVRNTVFSIRISYGKDDRNVIAGVTGQWAIGNIVVDVLARYDVNSMKLLLRGAPKIKLTIDLQNELDSLTGTYVPIPLPSFSLINIAVTGEFDLIKGGLATVVVSGSIGKNRVHAVFQKPLKAGKFSGAFAADIGPIRLSDVIRKTAQVDISRVPFFGSLTIPRLGVTVSSDYITSSLLPNVFCKEGLLQNTAVTIPKGLQAFTTLSFSGTKVQLRMQLYKSSLSFEVIRNGRLPIGTLISSIPGINIRSLPLPTGLNDIFQFQIDYFSLDTTTKQLVVTTQYPGTLSYFKNHITITNPSLDLYAILKQPRKIDFVVNGAISIGNGFYNTTIARDPSTNKYIVTASFETIPISEFIKRFSAAILPHAFQKRLKNFIQFSIHNAKLALPLGTRNLQLHLSGTPVIGGYKTVHLSAIIVRQGEKNKLVLGFQFGEVSLATLIYKITRKDVRDIAIVNQELDTSLLISPVSLPGVRLYGSSLKNINIVKGVSIYAALRWPKNCAQDKFCAVAQRVIGINAQLFLQATITSIKSFTLSAGVSDIRLGAGVVLQRAALQVMIGIEKSIGIEGAIHLNKIGITLSAGIRVGTRGVVLQGNMQGCWKRAFGVKWLSICNLHLLIAIQPTVTLVGALEIGGEVRIGNPSCLRHPLIAKGYVGVDQLSPNNNFYYVELKNKVTMGTVLKAFCIKFRLPRPLADSGFPKGFLSSYSPIGKELPKAGISIPAGFRLKGTLNILGLEAHADVTINLPKTVKMNVSLPPLRIAGGLLQIYASSTDKSSGPFLFVHVTLLPPKVDIHASGFASVLGIQAEIFLRINHTHYEFRIIGKLLNLFQASLNITASYGNIKRAGFRVRGYLKNDFFAIVNEKIQKGIQKLSQTGTKAIDKAKQRFNNKKVIFDKAAKKLRSAQDTVKSARDKFDGTAKNLRSWEEKVRELCTIKECDKKCIGCPGPLKCVKTVKVWRSRKCILKKPSWNSCCTRITNPTCLAQNKACEALRKTALTSLEGAKVLMDESKRIFDAAIELLKEAEKAAKNSRKCFNFVKTALTKLERTYKAATKAVSTIANVGLGGVFDIREVSFDVALSTAATGHFRASIVVSIFRKLKRFSLDINLRDILSFVKAIGERAVKGIKHFIS